MERPSVTLAIQGDPREHVEALRRAGFEASAIDPSQPGIALPHGRPDLAVVDCDLPSDAVAAIYAAFHIEPAVPTLLLVGTETELPTGIGSSSVDEVAMRPVPPEALVYRLQALLIRTGRHLPSESGDWANSEGLTAAPIAGEGHVVSIFAPKGGVGKTMLAVNLATALRQQTRSQVLLLDADVGVGNVTAALDVPYRFGLADLADSPPEEWTDAAFEQTVAVHAESGVRVLSWGTDPGESERVNVDLLLAAVRWARRQHSYIVVDNHPGYDDRTMAMLATSNEIFLVLTPEVGALRNSTQFLDLARDLGLINVIRVIVNRANHGIRLDDMSATLGLPISGTIVSSGPKAVIASNEGRPIVLKFPRDQISNDLHRVARLVTHADEPQPTAPRQSRKWFSFGARTSRA